MCKQISSQNSFKNKVTCKLFANKYFGCVGGYTFFIPDIGLVECSPMGDQGSIPRRVIPMTKKMALDTSLLNTQHYKVHIEGKVEQSEAKSSAFLNTSV